MQFKVFKNILNIHLKLFFQEDSHLGKSKTIDSNPLFQQSSIDKSFHAHLVHRCQCTILVEHHLNRVGSTFLFCPSVRPVFQPNPDWFPDTVGLIRSCSGANTSTWTSESHVSTSEKSLFGFLRQQKVEFSVPNQTPSMFYLNSRYGKDNVKEA